MTVHYKNCSKVKITIILFYIIICKFFHSLCAIDDSLNFRAVSNGKSEPPEERYRTNDIRDISAQLKLRCQC